MLYDSMTFKQAKGTQECSQRKLQKSIYKCSHRAGPRKFDGAGLRKLRIGFPPRRLALARDGVKALDRASAKVAFRVEQSTVS